MTNAEIYTYFRNAQTIPCGRFHRSQLNTDLRPREKEPSSWKHLYHKAAALFIFLTLKNTFSFAQTKEPTTTQPTTQRAVLDTAKQNVTISGVVKAEDGTAIKNAEISFNAEAITKTDDDGFFSFEPVGDPFSKSSVLKATYPGLVAVVRSYHPAMQSTSYNIVLEKPHFDNGITAGAPVIFNAFASQTFKQPRIMTGQFRRRLAEVAAAFRNNPNVNILIVGYGTKPKEKKAAKDLTKAVQTYFVDKEGIGNDRFFIKVEPMQAGKMRTFDIEPYIPN